MTADPDPFRSIPAKPLTPSMSLLSMVTLWVTVPFAPTAIPLPAVDPEPPLPDVPILLLVIVPVTVPPPVTMLAVMALPLEPLNVCALAEVPDTS